MNILQHKKIIVLLLVLAIKLCCKAQIFVSYISYSNETLSVKKNNNYKTIELAKKSIEEQVMIWQGKGYITASIDSIIEKKDTIISYVQLGKLYNWHTVFLNDSTEKLVQSIVPNIGYLNKNNFYKQINLPYTILHFLKNNGYPFASVKYTNLNIKDSDVTATLEIDKKIIYKIDSVRLFGNLNIKRKVLNKLLGINEGILYNESVLNNINNKLNKLNYLQQFKPWDITLLAKSSIVNVYVNKKNRNKLDAIIGFLPNNQQTGGSLLFTVDAKLHLENAFASGEIIDINWQQIQPQSPRVDISYNKPFFLNSNVGLLFDFNLYKRDTAFLNVQSKIGINYPINNKSSVDIFFSNASTRIIEPDTLYIIRNKRLPNVQDVNFNKLGITYYYNTTNNYITPTKGINVKIQTTAGLKTIEKNSNFINIKTGGTNFSNLYDSVSLNDYQLKIVANLNTYSSIGKQSVLKNNISIGWLQTNTFLTNEMYQIGGFKLLRGFDEENIFTNAYAVGSVEYRYIFGEKSYFFGFTDIGITQNKNMNKTYNYIGFGGGLALETKQGILQFSVALGKRNDIPLNFRETKIHIGLVNNF